MKILKQILVLVAASAFKLRVEDWTILHSRWTHVLHNTKIIFLTAAVVLTDNIIEISS